MYWEMAIAIHKLITNAKIKYDLCLFFIHTFMICPLHQKLLFVILGGKKEVVGALSASP